MTERPIIAVGVDESESSRRALAWAAREAVRRGATLQVVTAWSWDSADAASVAASMDPHSLLARTERIQRDAVAEIVDPMPDRPPVAHHVVRGTAAEALVEASRRAALVVVGTHGRGPVRSLLLGSVSLSVIKNAACPVVVMPPAPPASGTTDPALAGTG